jgi:ribosomal-protein-alanine N-acetyltransferase
MIQGPTVDLRLAEKGDLALIRDWMGDPAMSGVYESFPQHSLGDVEKDFESDPEERWYVVQAKDGERIGFLIHGKCAGGCWIGYQVVPERRRQGVGTEAVRLIVDYLFLHKDIGRIQAETHPDNTGSRRILEKAGFTFEGHIRRSSFSLGEWRDTAMHSILREEWQAPRLLAGAAEPAPA